VFFFVRWIKRPRITNAISGHAAAIRPFRRKLVPLWNVHQRVRNARGRFLRQLGRDARMGCANISVGARTYRNRRGGLAHRSGVCRFSLGLRGPPAPALAMPTEWHYKQRASAFEPIGYFLPASASASIAITVCAAAGTSVVQSIRTCATAALSGRVIVAIAVAGPPSCARACAAVAEPCSPLSGGGSRAVINRAGPCVMEYPACPWLLTLPLISATTRNPLTRRALSLFSTP